MVPGFRDCAAKCRAGFGGQLGEIIMNTIETTQKLTIDETFKPYASAFEALEAKGLPRKAVARYCEEYLAASCTDGNRKAAKAKTVSVTWRHNKAGGKVTVKTAGATYEFGDSAPARFVQVLNHLEALAGMFCPVDDMRLADSIVTHFLVSIDDRISADETASVEAAKTP